MDHFPQSLKTFIVLRSGSHIGPRILNSHSWTLQPLWYFEIRVFNSKPLNVNALTMVVNNEHHKTTVRLIWHQAHCDSPYTCRPLVVLFQLSLNNQIFLTAYSLYWLFISACTIWIMNRVATWFQVLIGFQFIWCLPELCTRSQGVNSLFKKVHRFIPTSQKRWCISLVNNGLV